MKKLLAFFIALIASAAIFAATETVEGVEYTYSISDGKATIGTGSDDAAIPTSTSGALVIPSKLGGCPVTTIGEGAFGDCYSLTSVTIPSCVTTIGSCAFYRCRSLTSVTIPSSVTTIGSCAFYRCRSLTSVTIPEGVTTIGDYAFFSCSSLISVTIPSSVTTIGDEAFEGCRPTMVYVSEGDVERVKEVLKNSCSGLKIDTLTFVTIQKNRSDKSREQTKRSRKSASTQLKVKGSSPIPSGPKSTKDAKGTTTSSRLL